MKKTLLLLMLIMTFSCSNNDDESIIEEQDEQPIKEEPEEPEEPETLLINKLKTEVYNYNMDYLPVIKHEIHYEYGGNSYVSL